MEENNISNNKSVPTTAELEAELYHQKYKNRYFKLLRSTIYTLVIVAAISVLVATILLPVFQIYGNSMTPTLRKGDIVFSVKTKNFDYGDVVAFYYNNRILVKRVIGAPGDIINIDAYGNVFVNENLIDEPYVKEKAYGETDITFPYTVPDNSYFLLGDHRATSVDSRNSSIGCIDRDEIVGKILFAVWPLSDIGIVK